MMQQINLSAQAPHISEVVYNAGTQCFEATVTFFAQGNPVRQPATLEAPITLPLEEAARRLLRQAEGSWRKPGQLRACLRDGAPIDKGAKPH